MKAKNKKIGDIYYNPMALDFWFLTKMYYEEDKKEKWTLSLIHTDYQVEFSAVDGFIKVGNIFDLLVVKEKGLDKLYTWGETLNPKFQKEMEQILKGEK